MSKNYKLPCSKFNGYDIGVIVIPYNSIATLSFTSDAAYENIILVSKNPNSHIIHVANNKTPNGLNNFIIKNHYNCPMSVFVSSWHLNPGSTNFLQNSMRKSVTNVNNYSYGFEDSTDGDFNDIVVNIKLETLC